MKTTSQAILEHVTGGPLVGSVLPISVSSTSVATAHGFGTADVITIAWPLADSTLWYGWSDDPAAAVSEVAMSGATTCGFLNPGEKATERPRGAYFVAKVGTGETTAVARLWKGGVS